MGTAERSGKRAGRDEGTGTNFDAVNRDHAPKGELQRNLVLIKIWQPFSQRVCLRIHGTVNQDWSSDMVILQLAL